MSVLGHEDVIVYFYLELHTLEKLTIFHMEKNIVFVWFFKEISLWKKCLFSKVGYSTFPS